MLHACAKGPWGFLLNKAAILRTPFMALSINPVNRCTFSGFKTWSVFSIASKNASLDDLILFVSSKRRFIISALSSSVSFRYGFLGFEGLSFKSSAVLPSFARSQDHRKYVR